MTITKPFPTFAFVANRRPLTVTLTKNIFGSQQCKSLLTCQSNSIPEMMTDSNFVAVHRSCDVSARNLCKDESYGDVSYLLFTYYGIVVNDCSIVHWLDIFSTGIL